MNPEACKVLLGNHSSASVMVTNAAGRRQVLVTPISAIHQPQAPSEQCSHSKFQRQSDVVDKVILRAVNSSAKTAKDSKAFILRHIKTNLVCTCEDLKQIIRNQLGIEITSDDFDVGYIQGSTVVRIQTKEDIAELWSNVKDPNGKIDVWCNGLREQGTPNTLKQKHDNKIDSDGVTKKKNTQTHKDDEVQEVVDNVKKRHGSSFTMMQYQI